jgi:hypothetical protein
MAMAAEGEIRCKEIWRRIAEIQPVFQELDFRGCNVNCPKQPTLWSSEAIGAIGE